MAVDYTPLKLYVQKVLPLVYDDSLSYYEQLLHFGVKINELIDEWNKFEVEYKAYTDEQVAKAKQEIEIELARTVNELNKKYTEFTGEVSETLQAYDVKLNQFEQTLTEQIAASQAYTDTAISLYDSVIKEYIAHQVIDVKVLNYFTGELVSVQEMFNYLAQFHLTNAITYNELAARNITYADFIALNMTYTELAINGANIIPN